MILDEPKLVVVGINHKNASIGEREIFQINRKEIRKALTYFRSIKSVEGVVIVSTCNRLEFYFVLIQGADPYVLLNDFYKNERKVKTLVGKNNFYIYEGINTAKHLFKVISGLDSMILGEYQVQGQIKDAYSIACSEKTADKILHKLFHAAFRTGKTVRTNTKIGQGDKSISGLALKLLKQRLDRTDPIVIIGINHNTKVIAQKLHEAGFSRLIFVNRSYYKAEEMAERYNGNSFRLDSIEEALVDSKGVVSCTGSPDFIINSQLLNKICSRKIYPKLIIDMAIPRDIDPRGLTKKTEFFNLEKLSNCLEEEVREAVFEISEAEKIIAHESRLFEVWNDAQSDNTFAMLDEKIESIRLQFLNEVKGELSENELELLDRFSHSLVHRMKSTVTQVVKINTGNNGIYKAG
jgi:glutamyl-tRNA reductase